MAANETRKSRFRNAICSFREPLNELKQDFRGAMRSIGRGLGYLALLAVVFGGLGGIYNSFWGEHRGSVKTDDCRMRIPLEEGSADTWFKKFMCEYSETKSGKVMRGFCQAVDLASDGVCNTVYFYDKKAPKVCTDPKFPYLGYDDLCHTEPQ